MKTESRYSKNKKAMVRAWEMFKRNNKYGRGKLYVDDYPTVFLKNEKRLPRKIKKAVKKKEKSYLEMMYTTVRSSPIIKTDRQWIRD